MTPTPRPLTPSNQFRRFKGPQTTVRPHSVTPAHSDMEPLSHMTATDRTLIHLGRAIAAQAHWWPHGTAACALGLTKQMMRMRCACIFTL